MYPHNYIPIYPHISILYQDNEGAHPYIYIYIYIYGGDVHLHYPDSLYTDLSRPIDLAIFLYRPTAECT